MQSSLQNIEQNGFAVLAMRRIREWLWWHKVRARDLIRDTMLRIREGVGLPHGQPPSLPRQWHSILKKSGALLGNLSSPTKPPVVFATVFGGRITPLYSALESILSAAIRLRGIETVSLICDRSLVACTYDPLGNHFLAAPASYTTTGITRVKCKDCIKGIEAYNIQELVSLIRLSKFGRTDDLARIDQLVSHTHPEKYSDYVYRDIKVGQHAYASVLRVLGRGTLMDDPYHTWLLHRHLISAILLTDLAERALKALRPRCIASIHGIYVDHGTISELAKRMGIPIVVYAIPYRRDTLMLCHGDTYHRALVTESPDLWKNLVLTPEKDKRLQEYVASRQEGSQDSINYHPNPIENRNSIIEQLGLDGHLPIVSMFTNVIWDAQIYHQYNAFENLLDWVFRTIEYFSHRSDVQLVIRVHPAEVKAVKKSNQPLAKEITDRFPFLPSNIKVIPPESDLSSYTLAEMSSAALIYGTKMGLEIALRGIPVIIAGESINRGKGFTYDVESPEQYFHLLDRVTEIPRNNEDMMLSAKKYGYHFYFRRQMDFPFLANPTATREASFTFRSLTDLLPGSNENLDRICDGIIHSSEFVAE